MKKQIFIRHISSLEEFEEIRSQWDVLFEKRQIKTIFLTWEWLFAWWKTHNQGRKLWLITAWIGNELVGIGPYMLSTEKKYNLSFRLLESLGAPNTDESDILALNSDPEILHAICNYIIENKKHWDAVLLHEHRDSLPNTEVIYNEFLRSGLRVKMPTNVHYYIPIFEDWEKYLNNLSRNTRQSIKRRLRRVEEKHKVRMELYRGKDVKWEHFNHIFMINKNGTYPDKYQSSTEQNFHKEIWRNMQHRGSIEIALLFFDNKPVAFEYGFNTNGRYEDWRTGFDREYSLHGAGKLLLYLLLENFFKGGYKEFDFLRGNHGHKEHWAAQGHNFNNILVVKNYHIVANLVLIVIPSIWKWIKTNIMKKETFP